MSFYSHQNHPETTRRKKWPYPLSVASLDEIRAKFEAWDAQKVEPVEGEFLDVSDLDLDELPPERNGDDEAERVRLDCIREAEARRKKRAKLVGATECRICQRPRAELTQDIVSGRCNRCRRFFERNGRERPLVMAK